MLLVRPFSRFASKSRLLAALTVLILALASEVRAGDTNVAVAANFTEPAKEIAQLFQSSTGHRAILSFGATGQFYTQITQAAPFQVFLAADEKTPKKLADDGLGVADSLFTYAIGKLVLFSTNATLVTGEQTLRDAKFNKIAIADPAVAPYGAAAVETMKKLGLYETRDPSREGGVGFLDGPRRREAALWQARTAFPVLSVSCALFSRGACWRSERTMYGGRSCRRCS